MDLRIGAAPHGFRLSVNDVGWGELGVFDRKPRFVQNPKSGWKNTQRVKKEDCESSPLEIIKITRSEVQATTEVRRRKRRTTIANEPIPKKTAEAGSGTAATEVMNA